VRLADFDRIVTHADGAVGVQVSQPVGEIKVRRGIETFGGKGDSLVKGVVIKLAAIALSVKPGGSIDRADTLAGCGLIRDNALTRSWRVPNFLALSDVAICARRDHALGYRLVSREGSCQSVAEIAQPKKASPMGVRTRGPDIKAGVAKFRADRAAREEAEAWSTAGIGDWRPGATCSGHRRSGPR
jgi:hypothetical protein